MTSLLLVEADILVRTALAAYLRKCGFRVIEATTVAEARVFLSDAGTEVDLVLAEIGQNGEDGFALASWIRNEQPGIDVILAGTLEAATRKAGDLCADEPSVSKPYDHQLVLERIRRAIAARERNHDHKA